MLSGKIVKVNERGFGFIQPDVQGEKDIFFHVTGLKNRAEYDSLSINDRVTYEVDDSKDRPRAVEVTKVE